MGACLPVPTFLGLLLLEVPRHPCACTASPHSYVRLREPGRAAAWGAWESSSMVACLPVPTFLGLLLLEVPRHPCACTASPHSYVRLREPGRAARTSARHLGACVIPVLAMSAQALCKEHPRRVVTWVRDPLAPESVLANPFCAWERCNARKLRHPTACAVCLQSVDGGTLESSGMSSDQWHGLTAHLSRTHAAFFKHWAGLVDMEEAGNRCVCVCGWVGARVLLRSLCVVTLIICAGTPAEITLCDHPRNLCRDTRPQLWAMRGEERERLGTCVAGLYLVVSAIRTLKGVLYDHRGLGNEVQFLLDKGLVCPGCASW
eukprot:1160556-Pelagomonas_calceolata.AAC.9